MHLVTAEYPRLKSPASSAKGSWLESDVKDCSLMRQLESHCKSELSTLTAINPVSYWLESSFINTTKRVLPSELEDTSGPGWLLDQDCLRCPRGQLAGRCQRRQLQNSHSGPG